LVTIKAHYCYSFLFTQNKFHQSAEQLKGALKVYADFPKPGILFYDIFSLFHDIRHFRLALDLFKTEIQSRHLIVDAIAGLESRGFLFGPTLALELGISFVPLRKKNKLPGAIESYSYTIEYGSDTLEVQKGSVKQGSNFVIIDDLLATGGSMSAAAHLIQKCGGNVVLTLVAIELLHLNGKSKLTTSCASLVKI